MSSPIMKASIVHQFGQPLTIEEVPVPALGRRDVLIKVAASGVCHTDLHAASGDWPVKPQLPFIPGHEGVGVVVATGEDVTAVKEGDRVGVPWLHDACGQCDFCLTGWETLCTAQHNTGYSVNGCFAEYVVADAAYVGHIPDGMDFVTAAPLLCAGVTTYKGLKEAEVRPGEWMTVVGVGGLGHLAIEYAKAMGMHVAAVDLGEEKLALARSLGAELTVDAAGEKDPAEYIQAEIGGTHGVLVTAVSPSAFRQSIGMLRRGGTCVLVGLPPGEFPLPIFEVVLKRLTVRGSIVGTRHDLAEALQIAHDFKIKPSVETQPLEAVNEVFDRLREGHVNGRIVIDRF